MLAPSPDKSYPVLDSLISVYCDWARNRSLMRQSRQRFDECDSYEVERIAKDVGLSPDELRHMARQGPNAAKLVLDRMAAQHLDAKALASSDPCTMRDLQRLCSDCASKKRCQRDLIIDPDNLAWRQYCPNSGTLAALQSQATSAR